LCGKRGVYSSATSEIKTSAEVQPQCRTHALQKICNVTGVTLKGVARCAQATFDQGASIMTTQQHILDFYMGPAVMTSGGAYAPMFDGLPCDLAALARVVQGLLLHEH